MIGSVLPGKFFLPVRKPVQDFLYNDALYNDAAKVGPGGCVDAVLLEPSDELVAPSCTGLAEIQRRYGLGLSALWTEISHSVASASPNTDW